jgi:hypothetical protein
MSKPIELSHSQWKQLREQLQKDYPRSVMLIRSRMQAKLGFVDREYKEYDYKQDIGRYTKNCVMLDFYSESKRTFFMIKYSDYIQKEVDTLW